MSSASVLYGILRATYLYFVAVVVLRMLDCHQIPLQKHFLHHPHQAGLMIQM